jgi:hypothetical protein
MTGESFFFFITLIGAIGWFIIIVLSQFWKGSDRFVIGIIVSLICGAYVYLNYSYIGEVGGPTAFLTFEGVSKVFANPFLLAAGWAHIMAIDLIIGIWIKNNAAKSNIKYPVVVIILLVTLLFTPLGFLLYELIKLMKNKTLSQNFTLEI